MKRPLLATIIVGILVILLVSALQLSTRVLQFEAGAAQVVTSYAAATRVIALRWQYGIIALFAFGMAWLTAASSRRGRMGLVAIALIIELVGVSWVCALYHTYFQPAPAIAAIVLAYVLGLAYMAIALRGRSVTAQSLFGERLAKEQVQRMISGDIPFRPEAQTCEATVVVCDVANKYDLADDSDPAEFCRITEGFIRRATGMFLDAGAFIQSADSEGVVALFGFPDQDPHHGDKAVRVALNFVDEFRKLKESNNTHGKCDVHLGVSSGTMIIAPMRNGERPTLLTCGEPVELARRFCVANRFYGSRILIGPRTFELASRYVVARPIDFLSGVNSRERHEIYEPLWPAAEAQPEQLARRDSFWNGVVFYREKRWAEAYSEFQKARGPNDDEDAPLQLYLRRLEPLALNLADLPMREG